MTLLSAVADRPRHARIACVPQFLHPLMAHRPALESFLERNLSTSGGDAQAIRLIFRQAYAARVAIQQARQELAQALVGLPIKARKVLLLLASAPRMLACA